MEASEPAGRARLVIIELGVPDQPGTPFSFGLTYRRLEGPT
jgi:hypothetical protein